jgi:hypothetical protein
MSINQGLRLGQGARMCAMSPEYSVYVYDIHTIVVHKGMEYHLRRTFNSASASDDGVRLDGEFYDKQRLEAAVSRDALPEYFADVIEYELSKGPNSIGVFGGQFTSIDVKLSDRPRLELVLDAPKDVHEKLNFGNIEMLQLPESMHIRIAGLTIYLSSVPNNTLKLKVGEDCSVNIANVNFDTLDVDARGGSIKLAVVDVMDDCELSTTYGAISAYKLKVKDATVLSVEGQISLEKCEGAIRAVTTTGNVSGTGKAAVKFKSVNGSNKYVRFTR